MSGKRFAALTELEWSTRKEDGSLETHRVRAGDVIEAGVLPSQSVAPLQKSSAIEPYDSRKHGEGWYERRQRAALDKAQRGQGGIEREPENALVATDNGIGGDG